LARLRDDYPEFIGRCAEVLAIGPDGSRAFRLYWRAEHLPFIGLSDADHRVTRLFRQEVDLLRLGRMPLVIVIDGEGIVRYIHHGASMTDIPDNHYLLEVIDRINELPLARRGSTNPGPQPSAGAGESDRMASQGACHAGSGHNPQEA
jgi:peroxiredoxin